MMTKHLTKIAGLVIFAGLVAATLYFYLPQVQDSSSGVVIREFDEARDTQPILELIAKDRYWLIASDDYSPEFMLKNRAPNKEEKEYYGKLSIKVLCEDGKFVGFVAYYLKNFFTGHLLFIAVKEEFRGKGYAQKLMEYALNDFKKQGASMVFLVTRVSNTKAQSVYKKTGYTETERDKDFVYFTKWL